jgi:hypothetical protein
VRCPANTIVDVSATASETLTLDPADPANSEAMAIRNVLRPVAVTAVKTALDARLTVAGQNTVVTALATLTGHPGQPVPATADVCARRVVPTEGSISILPSVGGFDLVAAIVPPQGRQRCAATRIVRAGLVTVDLAMIRTWRDRELRGTRFGRRAVSRYHLGAQSMRASRDASSRRLNWQAHSGDAAGCAAAGNLFGRRREWSS